MGFFDKLKFNGQDFEDSEVSEDSDYDYEYEEEAVKEEKPQTQTAAPVREAVRNGINVASGASLELKVVRPKEFESVPQIADHLLHRRTVVLNLEETNKETARRVIDFLSGVAYSLDGQLKKVAVNAEGNVWKVEYTKDGVTTTYYIGNKAFQYFEGYNAGTGGIG